MSNLNSTALTVLVTLFVLAVLVTLFVLRTLLVQIALLTYLMQIHTCNHMNRQLHTLQECIRTNNIKKLYNKLSYFVLTRDELTNLLTNCVLNERVLPFHHLLMYGDVYKLDVCKIHLFKLAVIECKLEIVNYFLNAHCVKTQNIKGGFAQLLQGSEATVRVICNNWTHVYCMYLSKQALTKDDLDQAIQFLVQHWNGHIVFAAMLEGNSNNVLIGQYMDDIIDKIFVHKNLSMFQTLLAHMDNINYKMEFCNITIKAIQDDYIEAFDAIMKRTQVSCEQNRDEYVSFTRNIRQYTPLQWCILFSSEQCFKYLIDNHAQLDMSNSMTLKLLSKCQCRKLLDMLPHQELLSNTKTNTELLNLACLHENYCLIKYLVDNNVCVNKNSENPHLCRIIYKPLQFSKNLESVQLLIKHGATLDSVPTFLLKKCFYKNNAPILKQLLCIDKPDLIRGIDYLNFKKIFAKSHLPVDILAHIGGFIDNTFFSPNKCTELLGQINSDCDDIIRQYILLYTKYSI